MCNYDCLNCDNTENCVLDEIELTEEELALSDEIDFLIKKEQSDEKIRQIDDAKKRAQAKFRQTDKGKECVHRMNTSDKGKERSRRYAKTEKRKAYNRAYQQTPKRKAYMKEYRKRYYAKKKAEMEAKLGENN